MSIKTRADVAELRRRLEEVELRLAQAFDLIAALDRARPAIPPPASAPGRSASPVAKPAAPAAPKPKSR